MDRLGNSKDGKKLIQWCKMKQRGGIEKINE